MLRQPLKKKNDHTKEEYEKLGRMLVAFSELGYADRRSFYVANLLKGMIVGFGSVVGATLVVGIVLFLLSVLGGFPIVGDIADSVKEMLGRTN